MKKLPIREFKFLKMTSAPENELANFFFRDNCVCVGKGEGGGGSEAYFWFT